METNEIIQPNQEVEINPEREEPSQPNTPQEKSVTHSSFLKKWTTLVVLSLALAIIIIDTTLLNVSLGTIIRDFNTTIQNIQWVITAYSLTLAALTITGGRIGDLFGRKRMFMLGAGIFAVGSFMASISQSVGGLLIGESIIEGIGAALMMPATASLLVANYSGKDRAIAFGVWGGIAGAASAIGPILGGYLTSNFSWRWGFRINIFVVAILLIGSLIIKESRDTREKPSIDYVGILLSAAGLLSIVFGFIESSTYGWWLAKKPVELLGHSFTVFGGSFVPFAVIIGTMLLNIFYIWEKRVEAQGKTPLVSMDIFRNRTFSAGIITTAVFSLGQVGLIFALPIFLQGVLKLDAFHTGLALLPLSVSILVMAPLAGILSNKIPPKFIVLTGIILNCIAILVLRASIAVDATTTALIPGLALYGMGMGMVMSQVSNLTYSAVPVYQAGEASGINNTLRQVGSSLGSAIIGAILLSLLSTNLISGISESKRIPSQYKSIIADHMNNQSSSIEFGGKAQFENALPQSLVQEITTISNEATVTAIRRSILYTIFFAILGFIAALFLPNRAKNSNEVQTPSSGH